MTNGLLVTLAIAVALIVGLMCLLPRPEPCGPAQRRERTSRRPVSGNVQPVVATELELIEFAPQTRMHLGVDDSGICGYRHGTIAGRWTVAALSGLFAGYTLCDGCLASVADVHGGAFVFNRIVGLLSTPRDYRGNDDDTILMRPLSAAVDVAGTRANDPREVAPGISYMPGTIKESTVLAVAS